MFGSVPKPLWSRVAPPDGQNRIEMVARSLIVQWNDRKLLVDVGCGDKWDAKSQEIFGFEPRMPPAVDGVTDVVITHLHFDHAGGLSFRDPAGALRPRYPAARHFVPGANLDNARNPNLRERASYLAENFDVLDQVDLTLTSDGDEIWPGLRLHRADGHTAGLHWLTLEAGGQTICFPSDLIPTSAHLPIPYVMGYDICAATAMVEKADFINRAVENDWLVVFQHDPNIPAARLEMAENRPMVREAVRL